MNEYKQVKVVAPRFGNEKYFRIIKDKKGIYTQSYYLNQINFDDWWIYKSTNNFRESTEEDIMNMKFAGTIFFSKEHYKKEDIDLWVTFGRENKLYTAGYLSRPFPPVSVINKINIKQ